MKFRDSRISMVASSHPMILVVLCVDVTKDPQRIEDETSYCDGYRSLRQACSTINADAPLYSLFRTAEGVGGREVHQRLYTVSTVTVVEWRKRFLEGGEFLEDDIRPGQTHSVITPEIIAEVNALVLDNRRITADETHWLLDISGVRLSKQQDEDHERDAAQRYPTHVQSVTYPVNTQAKEEAVPAVNQDRI
ncbi:histone-lysine N-methyltransferase SETMAR [Trichonephila clavipes]|nr:histone-lysine N-methyltransferase SETMAR [Trichonephila clavipes]